MPTVFPKLPTPHLTVTVDDSSAVLVGSLNVDTVAEARRALAGATGTGKHHFDLSAVTELDTAGALFLPDRLL